MKIDEIRIREAAGDDAESLIELNREFNVANHTAFEPAEVRLSLKNNPNECVFVAESGGRLIGFSCCQIYKSVCYIRPTIELTELFVVENMRRRNAGTQLISRIHQLAKTENALEINLRVNRKNEIAIQFYRSCGLDIANHQVLRIRYL